MGPGDGGRGGGAYQGNAPKNPYNSPSEQGGQRMARVSMGKTLQMNPEYTAKKATIPSWTNI